LPVYVDRKGVWHKQEVVQPHPDKNFEDPCHLVKAEKVFLQDAKKKYEVDFGFSIIHGTLGEDGSLQGLFRFFDLPYAGSGVLSSALAMDKSYSRKIFQMAEIPQVKFIKIDHHQWQKESPSTLDNVLQNLELPVFVKPCNMGSSVGVSKVNNKNELQKAIDHAFEFDYSVLCEAGSKVREVEISILGNYPDYQTSIIGEIIVNKDFYSYSAKYLDSEGASLQIPANLSEEQKKNITSLAVKAFSAIQGAGFARIDFFIQEKSNTIVLNEINTLPGFTPISMFPMLWEKSGVSNSELMAKIIDLGIQRHSAQKKLSILPDVER